MEFSDDNVVKVVRVVMVGRLLAVLAIILVVIVLAAKLDDAEYLTQPMGGFMSNIGCRAVHSNLGLELAMDGPQLGGGEVVSAEMSVTVSPELPGNGNRALSAPSSRYAAAWDLSPDECMLACTDHVGCESELSATEDCLDLDCFEQLGECIFACEEGCFTPVSVPGSNDSSPDPMAGCESCGCEVSCCFVCFTDAELSSSCLHSWCHERGVFLCQEEVRTEQDSSTFSGFCGETREWFQPSDDIAYTAHSGKRFDWFVGVPVSDLPSYCAWNKDNWFLHEPTEEEAGYLVSGVQDLALPVCIWAVLRLVALVVESYAMGLFSSECPHKHGPLPDFILFVVSSFVASSLLTTSTSMEVAQGNKNVLFMQVAPETQFMAFSAVILTVIMLFFTCCDVKGGFEAGKPPLWVETKLGFKEGDRTKGRSTANACCCCFCVLIFSLISLSFTFAVMFFTSTFTFGFTFSFAMNWPGVDLSMTISAARVLSFMLLLMDILSQVTKRLKTLHKFLHKREDSTKAAS